MEITTLRRAISLLQETRKGSSSIRLLHELRLLRQRLSIAPSEARDVTINRLKMELQSNKREKARRLEKNRKRLRQNGLFQRDARRFYRELGKQTIQITSPPSESEIEQYWGDILETEVCHNKSAFWLRRQIDGEMSQTAEQQWQPISDNEVTMCLKRMGNWKSPGPDQVYGFWVKRIICLHSDLTQNYNLLVQDPDSVPDWLSQGITTLIPKNDKTDQAKNYRPITCLSVFYKTLTSVIKQRIEGHLSQGNLMALEQKGCQQGSFGAKDHLLINKLLTEDCKAWHRSLSMAWVDYQNAYDSVPHSWVLQCLQLHKISPVLCRFLSRVMEGWRTSMVLSQGQGTVKTRIMQIRRGIFQGDSLSPLLFCMALNPLSTELNRTGCGYRMSMGKGRTAKRQLISHLLYMDDLKLYGRNPDQLDGLLHTVRTFSDGIQMKFGLDKCAITHFVNGKLSGNNTGVKVGKTETIKGLEPGQVYKHLGVDESNGIQHSTMRERLRREYFRRVKMVLRTELYGRNKVLAINELALPVLTYSFGVIHWGTTDLQQLDLRTRKLLTMHGVHHPSADVDRLYAPCNEGGRGLQQIEAMYKSCIVGLECYLRDSSNPYMQIVYECDSGRSRYSIKSMACRFTAVAEGSG